MHAFNYAVYLNKRHVESPRVERKASPLRLAAVGMTALCRELRGKQTRWTGKTRGSGNEIIWRGFTPAWGLVAILSWPGGR
jgi:hypothetical protein